MPSRITSALSHAYLEVLISGDRASARRVIDNAPALQHTEEILRLIDRDRVTGAGVAITQARARRTPSPRSW